MQDNKNIQLPQETENTSPQEAEKTLCHVQELQDVRDPSVPDHIQPPKSTVRHVSLLDLIFAQLCTNIICNSVLCEDIKTKEYIKPKGRPKQSSKLWLSKNKK